MHGALVGVLKISLGDEKVSVEDALKDKKAGQSCNLEPCSLLRGLVSVKQLLTGKQFFLIFGNCKSSIKSFIQLSRASKRRVGQI